MYNSKNISILRILLFFILPALLVCTVLFLPQSQAAAHASAPSVVFSRATCDVLDPITLTYTTEEFDLLNSNAFRRNVKVYFEITAAGIADYYVFGITSEGGAEYTHNRVEIGADVIEASYEVTNTGIFYINCYLYDADGVLLSIASVTVRSDMDPPEAFGSVNSMTDYRNVNTVFNVIFDTSSFSDLVSGHKEAYYSFRYTGAISDYISYRKVENFPETFTINNNGLLTIVYIDNAGNYAMGEYTFDKFDTTPPQVPAIIISPDSDMIFSGGYTASYTVTINYGADTQSGRADEQYCIINGRTVRYTAPFKLDSPINYTIMAKTVDKAGNSSEYAQATVSASTFDVYEPSVNGLKFLVDLTQNNPCSVEFVSSDFHSGVDYAYIEEPYMHFAKGVMNTFRAEFTVFDKTGLVIHVVDKAGNHAIRHITLAHFGDNRRGKDIRAYYEKYHALDFADYALNVADEINAAYLSLNVAILDDQTQNSDFDAIFALIDKLISGSSNHTYVIETVPVYVSGSLNYTINEADLSDYKKGDGVRLVMNGVKIEGEKEYVKTAGFRKGFADGFNLSAYYKDEVLTGLENGIFIEMNMPYGYYERNIVIIQKSTGQIIETEVYNNKIAFTLHDSGDYVMVIGGERAKPTPREGQKTISVFGKNMPYGAFFGIVFGIGGGCAAIVVVLIVIKKKRG